MFSVNPSASHVDIHFARYFHHFPLIVILILIHFFFFFKTCLSKLHRRQCPFDQSSVSIEAEDLPVNTALLQLISPSHHNGDHHEENHHDDQDQPMEEEVQSTTSLLSSLDKDQWQLYRSSRRCVEELALFLKISGGVPLLSRPMQRKLVTLITCQLAESEGRARAVRAARSLGERTVTELILQHQNPQQLSANLWAAVRARGCQFLGPAMQEEVLRLVLLALEDGSALSRKVLVMFVVQRLEPHFPQASKTSIGHVVQLLYRASCFKGTYNSQFVLIQLNNSNVLLSIQYLKEKATRL